MRRHGSAQVWVPDWVPHRYCVRSSRHDPTFGEGNAAPIYRPICHPIRIQAEIKRGEAVGFYVKRRENIKPPMSTEQLVARICDTLGITPEQLSQLRAIRAAAPSTIRLLSGAGS